MPDRPYAARPEGPGELPDARAITVRFARGDREAFAVFYDATFDDALADASRLTGRDEHFCLDTVQDAYLRAAKKLPAMDSWAACRSWLRTAIASSAVDRIRSESARTRRESAHGRQSVRDIESNPELAELLERLQSTLDDRQWHAVRLHIGHGLPLSAVGRAMSLSRDAAHGLVRRGLATLSAGARAEMKGATDDNA